MAKIRVYELAKELGKDNKVMENLIRGLGVEIKGVMSTLDDDQAELVRRQVQGGGRREPERNDPRASGPAAVIRRPGVARGRKMRSSSPRWPLVPRRRSCVPLRCNSSRSSSSPRR
ncbi:translation initiation factor IF-2 N-terminal domain-containing protein [Nannocystis pusilla]|uniref:Translation initiation factor IF-2 N-terminal domain-containing protein n=1 Tax=Nannocystis pusilla TaxID=889268 RepID=A0A9X3EPG2_9BACT|nr:translation initiation factor IF-2 N-terminal domain-containing protein [Nannocystis pusilla]MCY1007426.1 translation initiation factor IF-2 N-terminal domain-containing protein [Nannocystis pusilla]